MMRARMIARVFLLALMGAAMSCGGAVSGTMDAAVCEGGASVCGTGGHDAATMDGPRCNSAAMCDDHVYCNGVEQCAPGAQGADALGCVHSTTPACAAGMVCDESAHACHAGDAAVEAGDPCDMDNDGHQAATAQCGGDDCDDHDFYRHPHALELCTGNLANGQPAANHDEDCDPCTVFNPAVDGDGDQDRDGFPSSHCTNPWLTTSRPAACSLALLDVLDPMGTATRGTVAGNDCNDDPTPIILPGSGADGGVADGATADAGDGGDAGGPFTGRDIHRGQAEVCNGFDDNCNAQTDEGLPQVTLYPDCDGDGHGDANAPSAMACAGAFIAPCNGHPGASDHADCDDTNTAVFQSLTGYPDGDGDFYCTGPMVTLCAAAMLPAGYSDHCIAQGDCNDADGAVWASVMGYPDADGDGHCANGTIMAFCTNGSLPPGYQLGCPQGMTDCDDNNAAGWTVVTCHPDADGDGRCADGSSAMRCTNGTCPVGEQLSCPQGVTDCDDANAAVFVTLNCFYDADNDGFCTSGTSSARCTGGSCPVGMRLSCPNGTSDCDDARGDRWRNITCGYDIDDDGLCGGTNTYCAGNDCSSGYSLFGIRLRDPSTCGGDCDDFNPYVPSTARNGVPGWTFDSDCGRARYAGPTYAHCCGLFCGQPDPYSNTWSGIGCPTGYAFIGCSSNHISGGGNHSHGDDIAGAACTETQSCIGLEGSTDQLTAVCQPSP